MVGITIAELELFAEFANQRGMKVLQVGNVRMEFWQPAPKPVKVFAQTDEPVHPAEELELWRARARDHLNAFYASSGSFASDDDIETLAEQLRHEHYKRD